MPERVIFEFSFMGNYGGLPIKAKFGKDKETT